jgi:putative hydrolase of the HAD superfamily
MVVLFDLDGTLLDHDAAQTSAARSVHDSQGLRAPLVDFIADWRAAERRHYPRFLSGEIGLEEQRRARLREVLDCDLSDEAADALFVGVLAAYEAAWSLFPDVLDCLDSLAGHRLGVITNGDSTQQRRKLTATGIADRFSFVLVSGDCGHAKPDPRIFLRACRDLGVAPAQVTYVGDSYEIDAVAARRAGLRGVWLDRNQDKIAAHTGPVIRSLSELRVPG